MRFRLHPLACSLHAALALTLAACGGGGGSDAPVPVAAAGAASAPAAPAPSTSAEAAAAPAPAPASEPAAALAVVTIKGAVMVNQAVRNAVVCMDLNANNVCDAGEPVSAPTGADGAYTITYETSKVSAAQAASASLIAPMVPGGATVAGTTVDAADPDVGLTASGFVLRQVPGKDGQINPLTTLVAKGISDGMSEADARANAAIQLKINTAKIDDYQGDAATGATVRDNARWIAQMVKSALEAGVPLRVGDQNAAVAAASGDLTLFRYFNIGSYLARTYPVLAKAAGTPGAQIMDARFGRTHGTVADAAELYNFAYLTPHGWTRCDGPWAGTSGTPNRSTYCDGSESIGFSTSSDISGMSMVRVIADMQLDSASNTINNGVPVEQLGADLGSTAFPAGSRINHRTTMSLAPSLSINSLTGDGRPQNEAQTLEDLIAAKPASGVTLPSPGGSLSLGIGSSPVKNLRVAFTGTTDGTSGTVQFYECDLNSSQTVSNCAATVNGSYAITTINGARVMRFSGHPATASSTNRLYVEVQNTPTVATGNWVYQARETKMEIARASSKQERLNAVAWAAMRTQLGL